MEIRIKFTKGLEVKYISHLDLLRTFNRMLKRSGLDIAYSQGFNPHIILSFAQPLSVGVTSECEYAQIGLNKEIDKKEVIDKINQSAPPGIKVLDAAYNLEPKFKELSKAEYIVEIICNTDKDVIMDFLDNNEILIDKKTKKGIKEVDIKPLIYDYKFIDNENLYLKVAAGSEKNLNPELILSAFKKHIDGFILKYSSVVRKSLLTENEENFM